MAGTITPLYQELIEAIIKKQSSVVRIAIAMKRARNVRGIEVNDKGHSIDFTAIEKEALEGMSAIKAAGGPTIAQDPTTCVVDSIEDATADTILTPPQIAQYLCSLPPL